MPRDHPQDARDAWLKQLRLALHASGELAARLEREGRGAGVIGPIRRRIACALEEVDGLQER